MLSLTVIFGFTILYIVALAFFYVRLAFIYEAVQGEGGFKFGRDWSNILAYALVTQGAATIIGGAVMYVLWGQLL